MVKFETDQMNNRTDFSALEIITLVLKKIDFDQKNQIAITIDDYDWAIDTIRQQIEQTGRTI